jgi:arylsulfatase A-like enzyme
MGPLSGAKSTTLEGGIRVPLIIRWPGRIQPNTVSEQVSATFDLTSSFLRLAKTGTQAARLDGYDIIGHVTKQRADFPRTLYWRGRRGARTWWAVRDRDLKYVRKTEGAQSEEWLFDLSSDMGEKSNLYGTNPSDADRLKKMLSIWEAKVKSAR